MDYPLKEVDRHEYCPKCMYEKLDETESPCNDCMDEPVNEYSHKPLYFKPKEDKAHDKESHASEDVRR